MVNPKRVRRLLREDNLLCVRKRKFVVTTDSNHGRKVYPNLARNMLLTSTDIRIFFTLEKDSITVLDVAKRATIISSGQISGAR